MPCTGIFLGPSKSGKTVALISLILQQCRGVFERIYIFSPSVNIDDGWIPKKYTEEELAPKTTQKLPSEASIPGKGDKLGRLLWPRLASCPLMN